MYEGDHPGGAPHLQSRGVVVERALPVGCQRLRHRANVRAGWLDQRCSRSRGAETGAAQALIYPRHREPERSATSPAVAAARCARRCDGDGADWRAARGRVADGAAPSRSASRPRPRRRSPPRRGGDRVEERPRLHERSAGLQSLRRHRGALRRALPLRSTPKRVQVVAGAWPGSRSRFSGLLRRRPSRVGVVSPATPAPQRADRARHRGRAGTRGPPTRWRRRPSCSTRPATSTDTRHVASPSNPTGAVLTAPRSRCAGCVAGTNLL